jgi:hypothetical protein
VLFLIFFCILETSALFVLFSWAEVEQSARSTVLCQAYLPVHMTVIFANFSVVLVPHCLPPSNHGPTHFRHHCRRSNLPHVYATGEHHHPRYQPLFSPFHPTVAPSSPLVSPYSPPPPTDAERTRLTHVGRTCPGDAQGVSPGRDFVEVKQEIADFALLNIDPSGEDQRDRADEDGQDFYPVDESDSD